MARMIDADVALDRYYAEFEKQDICSGAQDRDWLMRCIEEAPTLTQHAMWISVKDRLPQTGTILATDGRVVITAPASSVTADGPAITHWMPLPELPGKEEIK